MKAVKISDHQQSMAPRPLRGAFLVSPAMFVVADFILDPIINTIYEVG